MVNRLQGLGLVPFRVTGARKMFALQTVAKGERQSVFAQFGMTIALQLRCSSKKTHTANYAI
jgi:hypothetical protein